MATGHNHRESKGRIDRRSLLRLTSGGALASSSYLSLVGSASASTSGDETEWVGVTYDPATHQELATSISHLSTVDGLLEGTLQAAGYDIPIRPADAVAIDGGEYPEIDYTIDGRRYVQDGLPLRIKFKYYGHGITGYVSRPSPRFAKMAYTLGSREDGFTVDAIRSGLRSGVGSTAAEPTKSFPQQGIPTRIGPADHEGASKGDPVATSNDANTGYATTSSDCSGTDRGDHGSYEEVEKWHTIDEYHDACETHFVTNYKVNHTVNPFSAPSEPYDEVHGSYKSYFLNSWFSNTPSPFIKSRCDPDSPGYETYLDSVEYVIRQHQNYDRSQWSFDDPRPDGEGEHENWIVDSLLDIAGGASDNTIVGLGTAAVKAYLAGRSPVDLDQGKYSEDPDRDQWWWDINAVDDLPTSPCDTTSVYYRIVPGTNSLSGALNYTWVRYNFYLAKHFNYNCNCKDYGFYLHSSDWVRNRYEFDIVS